MTKIFLIRHGEAEGNLYRRAQGQFDAPLTPRGLAQTEALAARFAGVSLSAAYSSDLSRAYLTALAAARGSGVPVTVDPRLREVAMGCWENQPWGNIEYQESEQLRYFSCSPDRWQVPGSEPFAETQNRMEAALREIGARHEGGTVAVASHGMAIRALLARVMGVPAADIRQLQHTENTGVALLYWEAGALRVAYYNDFSHLPAALRREGRRDWWRGGTESGNLRFAPWDTGGGQALYLQCYQDAWRVAHGTLRGFDGPMLWRGALVRAADSPQALQGAWLHRQFAGLLALDERRERGDGVGWIAFCYLVPALRGQRLGAQLIGEAAARFRALGRQRLQLCVAQDNPARGFYEHMGFRLCGTEPGAAEPLLKMEKVLE